MKEIKLFKELDLQGYNSRNLYKSEDRFILVEAEPGMTNKWLAYESNENGERLELLHEELNSKEMNDNILLNTVGYYI